MTAGGIILAASPVRKHRLRMKKLAHSLLVSVALGLPVAAKDKDIKLEEAPAGVRATVKKTLDAGATLEKIQLESDGVHYEATITDKNGFRWDIFMDATGNVVKTEQKKAKKKKE